MYLISIKNYKTVAFFILFSSSNPENYYAGKYYREKMFLFSEIKFSLD